MVSEMDVVMGLVHTKKQVFPFSVSPLDQLTRAVQVGNQQATYHIAMGVAILYVLSNPVNRSLFTELQLCTIFLGCWSDKPGHMCFKNKPISLPLIRDIYRDVMEQTLYLFETGST